MKHPAHPGRFVRNEIVAPLGLSVTRAALSALPNERANLSPEMALRTEKAFGASSDTLMRTQNSYDIAETGKRAGTIAVTPFAGRRIGAIPTRYRDRFIPFRSRSWAPTSPSAGHATTSRDRAQASSDSIIPDTSGSGWLPIDRRNGPSAATTARAPMANAKAT